LARLDNPYGALFAQSVSVTGGIVGLCLGLQIVLTLFSLFRTMGGKVVIVVLLLLAMLAGWQLFNGPIKTHLAAEVNSSTAEK
jgi:multisubunit Na+/H+ antiporter MnhG subunit